MYFLAMFLRTTKVVQLSILFNLHPHVGTDKFMVH
jgi:hypothetical protein